MDYLKSWGAGIIAAGAVIVTIIVVGLMAVFGIGWFQRGTANFRGQTSAIEKTKANGNFRIASYDRFFALCNGVKAAEQKIVIAERAVTDFKGTDQETTALADLNALQSNRVNLINEYNGLAQGKFTAGQFRDNRLPYQIDSTQENTTCA